MTSKKDKEGNIGYTYVWFEKQYLGLFLEIPRQKLLGACAWQRMTRRQGHALATTRQFYVIKTYSAIFLQKRKVHAIVSSGSYVQHLPVVLGQHYVPDTKKHSICFIFSSIFIVMSPFRSSECRSACRAEPPCGPHYLKRLKSIIWLKASAC
jgi:hypothetical protein